MLGAGAGLPPPRFSSSFRSFPHSIKEIPLANFPASVQLSELAHPVLALSNTTPSSSTPTRVSLKSYNRVLVLIQVKNGSTVTGSAITLKQASDVSGTGEKALSFSTMYADVDTGAADALTKTTVASDTFTTNTTNSKNLLYLIEVNASDLDRANSFDCFRVGTGDAANTTVTVTYLLYGTRYAGGADTLPGALLD